MFIVFEGLDGSGKTTQIDKLSQFFQTSNTPHLIVVEPGTTAFGERVRQLVLHEQLIITPRAELMLYESARAQLTDECIKPALDAGQVVVSDRYSLSSIAYQGYGRELSIDHVKHLDQWATGCLVPDLTLFLDIPANIVAQRQKGYKDRLEQEDDGFFQRVRDGYLRELETLSGAHVLDGLLPSDELFEQIKTTIMPYLDAA